jgi:glycosyltransferase involved in cell wall biosynthesis
MRLAVFIPAYNEQDTIGAVIATIPRHFSGVKEYKIFVIDDGSKDLTAHAARTAGAQVIGITPNRGLANAFNTGIDVCLDWGADIIVHLDADGQYDPAEIPKLIEPVLKGEADLVTGDRQIGRLAFMRPAKKCGNLLGSLFLRSLTGIKVNDVSSGFRAYNAAAARKLKVTSLHTYTHETLIRARRLGLRIIQIPITFSAREKGTSRLISGNLAVFKHIVKSVQGIFSAWRAKK